MLGGWYYLAHGFVLGKEDLEIVFELCQILLLLLRVPPHFIHQVFHIRMTLCKGNLLKYQKQVRMRLGRASSTAQQQFLCGIISRSFSRGILRFFGRRLDGEASWPEYAAVSGMSSRLMTSFGFGAVEEEAIGETSTSGGSGIEAGEGLVFFLRGLLPDGLLHNKRNVTRRIF
jgi:hypothetical protein